MFLPKFKWSDISQNDFTSSIDTTELQKLHTKLETIQPQQTDPAATTKTINDITDSIAGIFIQAASTSLKQSKPPYKRRFLTNLGLGQRVKLQGKNITAPEVNTINPNQLRQKTTFKRQVNFIKRRCITTLTFTRLTRQIN